MFLYLLFNIVCEFFVKEFCNKKKEKIYIKIGKVNIVFLLFVEFMIVYVENLRSFIYKILELKREFKRLLEIRFIFF